MNLLELSLFTSAVCIGIKIVTSQGMIFSEIGRRLELINKAWFKPFYSCHYCMASVYSVAMYSVFMPFTAATTYELPLMALAVCTFNGMLYNLSINVWDK
jgi:hypothetical protein